MQPREAKALNEEGRTFLDGKFSLHVLSAVASSPFQVHCFGCALRFPCSIPYPHLSHYSPYGFSDIAFRTRSAQDTVLSQAFKEPGTLGMFDDLPSDPPPDSPFSPCRLSGGVATFSGCRQMDSLSGSTILSSFRISGKLFAFSGFSFRTNSFSTRRFLSRRCFRQTQYRYLVHQMYGNESSQSKYFAGLMQTMAEQSL